MTRFTVHGKGLIGSRCRRRFAKNKINVTTHGNTITCARSKHKTEHINQNGSIFSYSNKDTILHQSKSATDYFGMRHAMYFAHASW